MKTLFKLLITLLILTALALGGIFLFVFSDKGSETMKPYLKAEIEKQIGMPVEISKLKLSKDNAQFDMTVNKNLVLEVDSNFSVFSQSFDGIYHVKADNFTYNDIKLREADVRGTFNGTPSDVKVDGKGTALDAPLDYSLRIIDNMPQKILATIKSIELAEVLQLAGQPSLAKGKVDVEIDMPNIGEDGATGFGHVTLNRATFNDALVKKLYNFTLPKKSYATAKLDAKLKGKIIELLADVKSNLFKIDLKNATVNTDTKKVVAEYHVDIKDMRILTKNRLLGAFKIAGDVELEGENYTLRGKSNSLGGELSFDIGEKSKVRLQKVAIAKILHFVKQPSYATGELSGTIMLKDKKMNAGTYDLQVKKGMLSQKTIQNNFGYKIPTKSHYTIDSKGKIANQHLNADVTLKSNLSDVKLTKIKVNLTNQYVDADYKVVVHDVAMFIPSSKGAKVTKVTLTGVVKKAKTLSIKGVSSGLGKKMEYAYDTKSASLDAIGLYVERLMAITGLPVYAKGTLNSKVKIDNLKTLDGTFSFSSDNLVTQPKAMKKLMGKALKTTIKLESKGSIKKGKAYLNTKIKSSLANVTLSKTVFDIKKKVLTTDYSVNVANLKNLYVVTGKKLYGKFNANGKVVKGKSLKVTGVTKSLGGSVNYTLLGDHLTSKISSVPIENIFKLLGDKSLILGKASGKVKFNTKRKSGVVDLSIGGFQLKSSKLTQRVKLLLKKDPARIIFKTTKLHADIKGDKVSYTLTAKGTRANIEISNGQLNNKSKTNTANFKFIYEKYTVAGKIKGSIDNPKISIDASSLLNDEMKKKLNKKIDKKLNKLLEGKTGKKINKALGGNVGNLLKGLKF